MLIYEGLVRLFACLTPIMAFLSFPLSFNIMETVHCLVCQDEKSMLVEALKDVIRWLAILILPFAFGAFAATIITVNTDQSNWINGVLLYTYFHAGMVLFAVLPWVKDAFNTLLAGNKNGIRPVGLWFGALWALLYLSLAAQLFAYWH